MLGRVFKAYDIRGTYPDLLNETLAWQIGYGTSKFLRGEAAAVGDTTPMMRNIIVGRDMRRSSPSLASEVIAGITDQGGDVIDVGLVDTPFIYFAINHLDCAGGVMTTASHNPPNYNGFKISKRKAKPVGEATGLSDIRKFAAMVERATVQKAGGRVHQRDLWEPYKAHVLNFLDMSAFKASKPLRVVVDASNAMAGLVVPKIFGKKGEGVPGLEIIEVNYDYSTGSFAHEPNPLVAYNLRHVQAAVLELKADFGICFDGDADRLVIVDEKSQIIGCDHLTAFLAKSFLAKHPGSSIVYDLRSSKAVEEEVRKAGGTPVRSRVGHVFMKAKMAETGAAFGGELSGHFYFRDNFFADSGVIAMAVTLSAIARTGKRVSDIFKPLARYVQSGEINFRIEEKDAAIEELRSELEGTGHIDELDGLSIDAFDREGWWMNVRKSNTEPLLRLNAEARDIRTLERVVSRVSPILGARVEQEQQH